MKFIVAFDSFKGCLSASGACHAATQAILQCVDGAEVVELPMSDGGEGLVACLSRSLDLERVEVKVHGPLMEEHTACYGISPDGKTAYMEMAEACGLTLVPADRRNPLLTTTYGVGEMMQDAVRRGCRSIVMGIGGSATCDGGRGMVEALRQHLDSRDGTCSIDGHPVHVTVASDVDNPLYGPRGAAYVFAPQKGATPEQVEELDQRLREFAASTEKLGIASPELAQQPGAGAAGGLGYALMAYLKADLCPGIQLVLDAVDFEEHLQGTDLVLTGEGKSDMQTLMGKVPVGVLRLCRAAEVPVCLLSGALEDEGELLKAGFHQVASINEGDSRPLSELMHPDVARENLQKSTQRLLSKLLFIKNKEK